MHSLNIALESSQKATVETRLMTLQDRKEIEHEALTPLAQKKLGPSIRG